MTSIHFHLTSILLLCTIYLLSCQACIQPQEQFSIPLLEVMPVNFVLLLIVDMVIIFGNLYLYKFLQQNTDRRKKGRTYCMKEDFPDLYLLGFSAAKS